MVLKVSFFCGYLITLGNGSTIFDSVEIGNTSFTVSMSLSMSLSVSVSVSMPIVRGSAEFKNKLMGVMVYF